jgi:hypothetical protein
MRLLGEIARVQVQRSSLKVGQPPRKRFDPSPLVEVAALRLDGGGVLGIGDDGEEIVDIHHPAHPDSRNRGGENGVSLGFTSHYAAMRQWFGPHLPDGIAGENVLIAADRRLSEADLARGVAIVTVGGGMVRLEKVVVATPCVEFTRYAMRFPADARPDATVAEALAFLNDGMRGYYATYRGPAVRIAAGDRVYVIEGK